MTRHPSRPLLARLAGVLRVGARPASRRLASLAILTDRQLDDIGLVRIRCGEHVLRYTDFG